MKETAYLVGPFIGELEWEFYRFAPYIINLKKENPTSKFIIYTRPSRFDFYGKYSDILVPLNLKYDDMFMQSGFSARGFRNEKYNVLITYLYNKYRYRFDILEHIYPDVRTWSARVKWQFPRDKMCYEFKPRDKNYEIVDGLFDSSASVFIDSSDGDVRRATHLEGYDPIMLHWLKDVVKDSSDGLNSSFIGCLMVIIKRCKFVVANISSSVGKLSLLLKTPVISINEEMDTDAILLLNPFKTPVINCENIEKGIKIYEDNF